MTYAWPGPISFSVPSSWTTRIVPDCRTEHVHREAVLDPDHTRRLVWDDGRALEENGFAAIVEVDERPVFLAARSALGGEAFEVLLGPDVWDLDDHEPTVAWVLVDQRKQVLACLRRNPDGDRRADCPRSDWLERQVRGRIGDGRQLPSREKRLLEVDVLGAVRFLPRGRCRFLRARERPVSRSGQHDGSARDDHCEREDGGDAPPPRESDDVADVLHG